MLLQEIWRSVVKALVLMLGLVSLPAYAQFAPGSPEQLNQQMQSEIAARQAALRQAGAMYALFAAQRANFLRQSALASRSRTMHGQTAGQAAVARTAGQATVAGGEIQNDLAILRMESMSQIADMQMGTQINLAAIQSSMMRSQSLHGAMQQAVQGSGQTTAAPDNQDVNPVLPVVPNPMVMRPSFGNSFVVAKPTFSVESGKVDAGTKVKIKTDTHYSTVYYTTDGWTPTTESRKFTGPITINETTHLQTIAVGPNLLRSQVNHADYTVAGAKPKAAEPLVIPADGVLRLGTMLHLVTIGPDVSSEKAEVGDTIAFALDQDVKLGDIVLAAKGTKVEGVLTIADAALKGGPGDLVFEVQSMEIGGKKVAIYASETMEGAPGLMGDKEAIIHAGLPVTAYVAADATFKP
jgi:hypothetical protein